MLPFLSISVLKIASVYIPLLLLAQELHENCSTCSLKGETSGGAVVELNFTYPNFPFFLLFNLIFSAKGIPSKYVFFLFFPSLLILLNNSSLHFPFIGGLDPLHPWWAATQPPTSCGCPSAGHWEWPCPHPQLGWGKHWLGYPYMWALNLLLWFSCVGWNFILAKIAGRAVSKVCFS